MFNIREKEKNRKLLKFSKKRNTVGHFKMVSSWIMLLNVWLVFMWPRDFLGTVVESGLEVWSTIHYQDRLWPGPWITLVLSQHSRSKSGMDSEMNSLLKTVYQAICKLSTKNEHLVIECRCTCVDSGSRVYSIWERIVWTICHIWYVKSISASISP